MTNIPARKIITENVIFHNFYMSKYVQSEKTCPFCCCTLFMKLFQKAVYITCDPF